MTKMLTPEVIEDIREKSRKLCEKWLDEITEQGETTGDYNTALCTYLSAAKYLLDKIEMVVKSGGGTMVQYPDFTSTPKEGN
jgi:hypothetical protein